MKMKLKIALLVTAVAVCGHAQSQKLETSYLKEGEIIKEEIDIAVLIKDGSIKNQYIDSVTFGILDSVSFENDNPNRIALQQKPVSLDFKKSIEKDSPEYHSLFTCHHITKAIKYYDKLFNGRIEFNSQKKYRSIEVVFGDAALLSTPQKYIEARGAVISPSLFYHEIGHRAFWFLEDGLGIHFHGLSVIHMGLLEYFTISLNDSPIVGEGFFPAKIIRDASLMHPYPLNESYNLNCTFQLLKDSYPKEIRNSNSFIARYYHASMSYYGDVLSQKVDNHRGGMALTSTLWRIRQQAGRDKTDKLVAETILNLNQYMDRRAGFYRSGEERPEEICWYDLFYGLIAKDNELFNGADREIIKKEFERTGYPIENVRLAPSMNAHYGNYRP
jgi:hypothetical protein